MSTVKTCIAPNCPHPMQAKGYCQAHYDRVRRGYPVGGPVRRQVRQPGAWARSAAGKLLREHDAFQRAQQDFLTERMDRLILQRLPSVVIAERMGSSTTTVNARARKLGVDLPGFVEWLETEGA